jgi:glucokinase
MHSKSSPSRSIGVDLGGTKIEAALVDSDGRVLTRHRVETQARRGSGPVIQDAVKAVRRCLDAEGGAAAVGIGIAGQVDRESGVVRAAPNLRWTEVPLKQEMELALSLPVLVTNDVRAAAWGEWRHGAGVGVDDLVCLFVGTGIGGGVVSGGVMLTGAANTAGELGHTVILHGGRKCTCPGSGCLEAYAGGWAIAARAREACLADSVAGRPLLERAGGADAISAESVADLGSRGDPLCLQIMEETAQYLASGLVTAINAFNPKLVILGGGVIEGAPWLLRLVEAAASPRALRTAAGVLSFARATLAGDAGVVGAADMAAHRAAEKS